jgi:hypothetical protein
VVVDVTTASEDAALAPVSTEVDAAGGPGTETDGGSVDDQDDGCGERNLGEQGGEVTALG